MKKLPIKVVQPRYTNCKNCGAVDHNKYNCPCECHIQKEKR